MALEIKDIQKRLEKIDIELVHEAYIDGWNLKALREEKEKLEIQLVGLTGNSSSSNDKNR